MSTTILDAALALARNGVSVVPVRSDGTKRPAGEWKQHQEERATPDKIQEWFEPAAGTDGLARFTAVGVITGTISGNLEMAEIEGRAAYHIPAIQQLAYDSGLGELWNKVCNGWLERSPSGGMHWFYRLTETPGRNMKLAGRPATLEELAENPKDKRKVLTETRGEGGFVVVAPTGGHAHESGQPWEYVAGGPATVPTLTPEECEQFHGLLASINEEPPAAPAPPRQAPGVPAAGGLFGTVSPGDDYEQQTDWRDILIPAGWRFAFEDGAGVRYWTRPGKSYGISATTGKDPARDRLFVFTSASDFDAESPYTKFGAYALLNHGGNHSAAASALRKGGFGKDPEISLGGPAAGGGSVFAPPAGATPGSQPAAAPDDDFWAQPSPAARLAAAPAAQEQPATEGNLATVTEIRPRPLGTMAHTDDGNAAKLIAEYGTRLRYNAENGKWLYWTGTVWEWQLGDPGMARELGKDVIRAMDVTGDDAARTWKKKSLSAAGISNMLTQAQTDVRIRVKTADLDAKGWELNTPAGIVDLHNGQLLPPNPESLHTKLTKCAPDLDARSELWESFLNDTFKGDQEMIGYIQRLAGYSAIGEVREHILPFAYGKGGNGKGVLFETLKAVLGEYAVAAPPRFLMKEQFQGHTTDLTLLQGARMVINSEVNKDDVFDEAKIKQLAGGDTITARKMRSDNMSFDPTHQMWLMGNYRPAVEAGGDSFWRRVVLIPFTNKIPEDKKIEGLQNSLSKEHGPAILAWIIRGAVAYGLEGLRAPASVLAATKEYAEEVDTVARFLEDEAVVEEAPLAGVPQAMTPCNTVINAYERWCRQEGVSPLKGKSLANALREHGVESGRNVPRTVTGQRQYAGITLRAKSMFYPADGDLPATGTVFGGGAGAGRIW